MSDDFTGSSVRRDMIDWRGHVGIVDYSEGGRSQLAIFYTRAVHDPQASVAAGRPIFKDMTYVRVAPPGERLNVVDRPANNEDRRRWPVQWHQFANNHEQIPEGTPIGQLYPDRPAIAQTLQASGVHTIEQCAELSAHAMDNIGMGAQSWVNAAKDYLEKANKGVSITSHRKEMEQKDQQIRILQGQVSELSNELSSLRQKAAQSVNMAQVQQLIASQMGRPTMPAPGVAVDKGFDSQVQQINAVNRAHRQRVKIR